MEKNELALKRTGKVELLEQINSCLRKTKNGNDEISLYDLLLFSIGVRKNIEIKEIILLEKLEKEFEKKDIFYFDNFYSFIEPTEERYKFECGCENIYYNQEENTLKWEFTITLWKCFNVSGYEKQMENQYQLVYKKIDNKIYLVEGPSDMKNPLYKVNEILMTEFYPYFERIFHLYELKEKCKETIVIQINGFHILLNKNILEISNDYLESDERALLKQKGFFLIYEMKEDKVKKQIFSSFRDIMVLLKDKEEDFLKGFYVDKSSLKESTRELLDEYLDLNPIFSKTKDGLVKQKSIFDWLKKTFNSTSK